MASQVVNLRTGDPYDLYIGKAAQIRDMAGNPTDLDRSEWANPFHMDEYHTREQALGLYYWHLIQSGLYQRTHELRDKVLGCWCQPQACHGHMLSFLSRGIHLPDVHEHRWWQECQFCGAPFVFWRSDVDPIDVWLNGDKNVLYMPQVYSHINGNQIINGSMIGCMVCQKIGMYAMHPNETRQGNLWLAAENALKRERDFAAKLPKKRVR